MRYLSLFSGIGGFECALSQRYKSKAVCVGYSEIYKPAIEEYERHYPDHVNLGDINCITKKTVTKLGRIDLLVGGFPCNNLSSANSSNRSGLDGPKSGLFWIMLRVIGWVLQTNPGLKIIIENNASMSNKWRDTITHELSRVFKRRVYCNYIDSSQWVVQRRRRYYWTLKEVPAYNGPRLQQMGDVLVPLREARGLAVSDNIINCLNESPSYLTQKHGHYVARGKKEGFYILAHVEYPTRWISRYSTTLDGYIRCITTSKTNCILFDYRVGSEHFIPRFLSKSELNRLFMYPENYVASGSITCCYKLYGMSVIPCVIHYILCQI